MNAPTQIETLLKQGLPREALSALQNEIRNSPAATAPRIVLFQLLALLEDWPRAQTQLDTLDKLSQEHATFSQVYRRVVAAEQSRIAVLAGQQAPIVIGTPSPWIAKLIEALRLTGEQQHAAAEALREQALEEAPAIGGQIDNLPFAWLSDADSRLGPVLEVILNGQYRWVPLDTLAGIEISAPNSLADTVWARATLHMHDGQQTPVLIPVRYPGSASADAQLTMARATEWQQVHEQTWLGLGQREFASDQGEHALLNIRSIRFDKVAA